MTSNNASVTVDFDQQVYRLAAVAKAAYRLGDRCFAQVEQTSEGRIRVTLTAKKPTEDLERAAGDLLNEALDQELREVVAGETADVRNLLLAQAFSATSLVDPQGETADFHDDPLGIARPDVQSVGECEHP